MKYISLVFEFNTGFEGLQRASAFSIRALVKDWRRQETADQAGASIWIAYTSDERWKTAIPLDFEEHGFFQIGPMRYADAEKAITNIKATLDELGVDYTEQTTSDD